MEEECSAKTRCMPRARLFREQKWLYTPLSLFQMTLTTKFKCYYYYYIYFYGRRTLELKQGVRLALDYSRVKRVYTRLSFFQPYLFMKVKNIFKTK